MLRALELQDAKRMLEWMHDKETMSYLRFDGASKTIHDAELFIMQAKEEYENPNRQGFHLAIVDINDTYCGTISLKNIANADAELAIAIHPDSVDKGMGKQAIQEMLKLAFSELKINRVHLIVREKNRRAIHVYEELGFSYIHSTEESPSRKNVIIRWYELTREAYCKM